MNSYVVVPTSAAPRVAVAAVEKYAEWQRAEVAGIEPAGRVEGQHASLAPVQNQYSAGPARHRHIERLVLVRA